MKYILTGCAVSFFAIGICFSQAEIPIGTWRTHLAFSEANKVALAGDRVYASTNNGVFFLDKTDNSINKITRIDGLSDISISAMGASSNGEFLLMGYANGNLDILADNEITNFPTIRDSGLPGSKNINHILVVNDLAYLSTDFGVVVLDIPSLEIRETYQGLANDGSSLKISASILHNNQIFLSTDDGIISGNLTDGSNLQDFNSWRRYSLVDGISQLPSPTITLAFGEPFAAIDGDGLYRYDGNLWVRLVPFSGETFKSLNFGTDLVAITSSGLFKLNSQFVVEEIISNLFLNPSQIDQDADGIVWISDNSNGLLTDFSGSLESIFPSGPFSDNTFRLKQLGEQTVALAGGYNTVSAPDRNDAGYFVFEKGVWQNYNNVGLAGSIPTAAVLDFVDAEETNGQIFLASFGSGLVQWDGASAFSVFDETNSPLQNSDPPGRNLFLSALASNTQGLWVANYGVSQSLHLLDIDNTWQSFSLQSTQAQFPVGLEISAFGDKWLTIDPTVGGGIIVYNEELDEQRHLNTQDGNGGLPSNTVNDVAIDNRDQAWVATERGIVFFQSASSVLTDTNVDAIFPIFENNILLRNQNITAIAVDGGNRKWIGTETGLWLFSDDGERLVYNFNTDNSPILSNVIIDIAVNQKSGEVFIATDQGMISFRGTATEGSSTHGNIKIFPNPVTATFNGLVGITGLATNAVVKITDISGKLVFQTKSEGGTATWNVLNHRGEKAQTGVYLVFSSTTNGDDSLVGKIAIVN